MNKKNNIRASLFMVAAMIFITSNDALVKSVSESMSVNQILCLRGFIACTLFSLFLIYKRLPIISPDLFHPKNVQRSALEVGSTYCFVMGLSLLPIAVNTALAWTYPIIITLLSMLFLKEKVGLNKWVVVFVGFTGVLIITRPFSESATTAMLLPLLAALLISLRDYVTRQVPYDIHPLHVTFLSLISVTLAGALLSWNADWSMVDKIILIKLSIAATLMSAGFLFTITAIRLGDLSFIAPFTFTGVLASVVIGNVVWQDPISTSMSIGVFLIFFSCLYLLRTSKRES